jgi:hypothetical protein
LGRDHRPPATNQYCDSLISLLLLLNITFVIVEVFTLVTSKLKGAMDKIDRWKYNFRVAFKQVSVHYKSSFLALLVHDFLPKLILVRIFWVWMPHFQKLQLFPVNLEW